MNVSLNGTSAGMFGPCKLARAVRAVAASATIDIGLADRKSVERAALPEDTEQIFYVVLSPESWLSASERCAL